MVNSVSLLGKITEAGVKLTYSDKGMPECRWTLLLEEAGTDGKSFRTFIPCHSYGKSAESIAEQVEPGDYIMIGDGKLKMRGWTTPAGEKERRLEVLAWSVQVVAISQRTESPADA